MKFFEKLSDGILYHGILEPAEYVRFSIENLTSRTKAQINSVLDGDKSDMPEKK